MLARRGAGAQSPRERSSVAPSPKYLACNLSRALKPVKITLRRSNVQLPTLSAELSVIVINYNTAGLLSRCLESLGRHLNSLSFEICVVDNASRDGSCALVKTRFPAVHLIANSRNRGFATAVNQGLKNTTGRYVLWMNPDAELLDEGLQDLVLYLDQHPNVGILGPQTVYPDGSHQLTCRSFPSYQTALFNRHSLLTKWFPRNPFSQRYLRLNLNTSGVQPVDWLAGACLLHRREVSDQLGGLDERFFMYCEDVDFCFRARKQGWEILFHPAARVLHRTAASSSQFPYRMLIEHHRSIWRYYTKHFRRSFLGDLLIRIGILARCGFLLLGEFLRRFTYGRQTS